MAERWLKAKPLVIHSGTVPAVPFFVSRRWLISLPIKPEKFIISAWSNTISPDLSAFSWIEVNPAVRFMLSSGDSNSSFRNLSSVINKLPENSIPRLLSAFISVITP